MHCILAKNEFHLLLLGLSPVKFKRKLIRHKVIKLLQEKYILKWQEELFRDNSNSDHGNKLRTYRLFKSNFCFEKYLEWGDYRKRKNITRFRLSAHDLEIEKGRYTGVHGHC
jgi:hypothetical protein